MTTLGTLLREAVAKREAHSPKPGDVILEHWGYVVPGNPVFGLSGSVYGHPKFPDGTYITTSSLVWIDESAGLAKTLNTHYILRNRVPV
jgi:hypothetical protein